VGLSQIKIDDGEKNEVQDEIVKRNGKSESCAPGFGNEKGGKKR